MKDAIKNLEYFVGKAVTVITTPINRDFDERQVCDYFVGVVLSVDTLGVMTKHPITGCQNYYFYNQICSISEEQVVDTDDPEQIPLVQEIRKNQEARADAIAKSESSRFIDVDSLINMKSH